MKLGNSQSHAFLAKNLKSIATQSQCLGLLKRQVSLTHDTYTFGSLLPLDGMRCVPTMVARATRWFRHCQLNLPFGSFLRITTDKGRQFEADIRNNLAKIMRFARKRTTAYPPQTNGCVIIFDRSLQAVQMALWAQTTGRELFQFYLVS